MDIDTPWTNFRWWLATRAINAALALAPKGEARDYLHACVGEWARKCREQWALRYGHRAPL